MLKDAFHDQQIVAPLKHTIIIDAIPSLVDAFHDQQIVAPLKHSGGGLGGYPLGMPSTINRSWPH